MSHPEDAVPLVSDVIEDDFEFIEDDSELLDTGSVSLRPNRRLVTRDHSPEGLERIAADIRARHAGNRTEYHASDDSIRQLDAAMYCFFLPVSKSQYQLAFILLLINISLQDHRVKPLESQLLALKESTSATPLLEHVLTAPHLPRHLFVLASPTTIGTVVRRLSLPLPRLVPRHEWGNSLDAVPWTRHRKYPLGSFVKITEPGPYHGDLGYVMAVDFKEDESTAHSQGQPTIISTPQCIVVAVVPRLRVKRSRRRRAPLESDARSLAIQEQVNAAFQAESLHLEKVVQSMREQTTIATLRKDLLKEKNDVVWRHGQAKRGIERIEAELMTGTGKAMKDLRRELRQAGGLRTSAVKELRELREKMQFIKQDTSKRIATEISSYEHQLKSVQSRVDAIEPPPDPPLKSKPRQALFNCESVEKKAPGACIPFVYTTDDIFEFTGDIPHCFDRPAILTNAVTHQPDVGAKFLTLWSLDTMISPLDGECAFFYQGRVFFRGLELVPIHDNRALEFAHPTVRDLEPFIQCRFDGPRINRFFSTLHWRHGDKLTYGDDRVSWYYLMEVLWTDQSVRARKINSFFGDPNMDDNNPGLDDVQLHLQWTKRAFEVGDNVEITFGPHKGISGMLIAVTDEMVTVMTTNFADVSKDLHLVQ